MYTPYNSEHLKNSLVSIWTTYAGEQ